MIQTIIFHGSDAMSQRACNQAALEANKFLQTFGIDREHLVSTNTNYQTTFAEGVSISECIVTLVVDTPYTIQDILKTPREAGTIDCVGCGQSAYVGRFFENGRYRYWYNCSACDHSEADITVPDSIIGYLEEQEQQFPFPPDEF